MNGKLFIFSAPSGSGKTTIVKHILSKIPDLEFSISATSRKPRSNETDGKDYYFISFDDFLKRVANNEFIEWEEVYTGTCYGTLKSEVKRIWDKNHHVVFDVDVKGGVNLKKIFGEQALAVFISPPSLEILKQRLEARCTETPESLAKRVGKAAEEMTYADKFDEIIINDKLNDSLAKAETLVRNFIKS